MYYTMQVISVMVEYLRDVLYNASIHSTYKYS